jgi:hypothetical protein
MSRLIITSVLIGLFASACSLTKPIKVPFTVEAGAPDYSDSLSWAALPGMKDSADHIPAVGLTDGQLDAKADVFFIHPTSFFSRTSWNAAVDDEKVINHTDEGTIYHQASVFNGSCRIFAPRYRQASYQTFFSGDDPGASKAFDLAYKDVEAAFDYYLTHYRNGRPFIIASHSQGTLHAERLIRKYIDGKDLAEGMIAAYLIGLPVYDTSFSAIPVCESENQTGCFVSWRSFLEGHNPKYTYPNSDQIVVVNPLTWTTDTALAEEDQHVGGLGRKGKTIYPAIVHTRIKEDILWVSKPDIPGKVFLVMRNYHRADYNLYWMDIRHNVAIRIDEWYAKNRQ